MGLAPYGEKVNKQFYNFPHKYDGIITDYSDFCEEGNYDIKQTHNKPTTFEDKARAAYEVQEECEKALLHLANYAKTTGKSKLCISGGVGLNSVSNNKIRINKKKLFDEIFINPAASDTGIPFGAALYGYHVLGNKPINSKPLSPFLGPDYSTTDIENSIIDYKDKKNSFYIIKENSFEVASKLLKQNYIVANFQGRSEMGPRALGNRSILMSPMGKENKDRLNLRVKHRESFRPFAPAVLAEKAHELFEIDVESPYMLFICDVKKEKRHLLPAITHVDGSARLQTLTKERNGRFYDLVKQFGKDTGVPVLLNTSFNVNGEPIVETPDNAINCFIKTDIDALLIENFILIKSNIDKNIFF
jgi:carbamoyltransferase